MKRISLIASLLLLLVFTAKAARVDSIAIESRAMKNTVKTVVIVPDVATQKPGKACPVIYLLHGYSGNQKDWLKLKPTLPQIADEKGIIFVCPDGKNSWYLDSPLDKTSQYETFISFELVSYIDSNYNTKADRNNRAITGLSMGGHGALYNALRHKDVFGAAGSMSGAVDIRQRGDNFGLKNLLGNINENRENWEARSVLNQIDQIENGDLAIYFDCGVSDFCYKYNQALNEVLWAKGIDHEYTIRQGDHNGVYWSNSIDYHILFFCKFFNAKK